jgi:FlaA1/EpsC-like NDP-sugar epimerase
MAALTTRVLDVQELLGRPPVRLDDQAVQRLCAGRRIMITGAGGSIGSELCRQISRFSPERLVLVERGENALFEIDRELREQWVGADLSPELIDIAEPRQLEKVFAAHRPAVVLHAAAHKHVPLMERHPAAAIRNNVLGTARLADAAEAAGVGAFVLISTDKAVRPTSVMGATKRLAEQIILARRGNRTRFCAVRFGNVLGSNGSVVPIFERQIDAGGPITITHPDMKRFFMTIPEASQLVLRSAALGEAGCVFVLEMGEPVRIVELAEAMIRRRGLTVGDDIALKFTGTRPGEKLSEELAQDDEPARPTACDKVRMLRPPVADPHAIRQLLANLAKLEDATPDTVRAALRDAVPTYTGGPAMKLAA